MEKDTLSYDSLNNRPLPKWLVDQKSAKTTLQTQKIVLREDHSLKISFIATGVFILLAITILTVYFLKKQRQ